MKYILILAIVGLITILFLSGFMIRIARAELRRKRRAWR